MKQRQQKKRNKFIHDEQGVALIYALVVLTVIFALALALLYGVGQVSLMTNSNREQEDCYFQAVTLSDVLCQELTSETSTGSGIYQAAYRYMPLADSDDIVDCVQFQADVPGDGYGKAIVSLQNGIDDSVVDQPLWQSKERSNQYLDLTVEVWGEKGGKESVTTRYRYYQLLSDDEMEYSLYTNMFSGNTDDIREYQLKLTLVNNEYTFCVMDGEKEIKNPFVVWDDSDPTNRYNLSKVVTLEMAENWKGEQQDFGRRGLHYTRPEGWNDWAEIDAKVQITRKRTAIAAEGGSDASNCRFKKIATR